MRKNVISNAIVLIFVFFLISPIFLSPILAQTDTTSPTANPFSNLASLSGAGFCEENGLHSVYNETNVFEKSGTVQSMMYTLLGMVGGCYATVTDTNGNSSSVIRGGVISTLAQASGALYSTRPVSLAWQIDNTLNNISPNKEALAETYLSGMPTGATLLETVSKLHSALLNIVLTFYILVFIIIGGAMIFRNKIGGQQYVSIVNSIPRVIVSLVLVIFSFPISGLMIDIGNVGYSLVYDIFVNQLPLSNTGEAKHGNNKFLGLDKNSPFLKQLLPTSEQMSIWKIYGFSGATALELGTNSTINFVEPELTAIGKNKDLGITSLIVTVIQGLAKDSIKADSGISGIIVFAMTLGAAFAMFKILFSLIKEYLVMLFYPVISPFQFAMYALPGQDKQIMNYIKTMLGSVLSFVGVYAVFVLIVFLGQKLLIDTNNNKVNPALLGFNGSVPTDLLVSIAAYGLFLLSPSVPEMVKGAIGSSASSFSKYGSQIAETTKSAVRRIPIVGGFV
ncbi:MAG: hypothetical protein WCK31_00515 [bacterium]